MSERLALALSCAAILVVLFGAVRRGRQAPRASPGIRSSRRHSRLGGATIGLSRILEDEAASGNGAWEVTVRND